MNAYQAHRLEQMRRAAAWPLGQRLLWLEQSLAMAQHISATRHCQPPAWVTGRSDNAVHGPATSDHRSASATEHTPM